MPMYRAFRLNKFWLLIIVFSWFKPILKRISPEVKFGIFLFYNTSVYKGFRNIERYNFFLKIVRNPTFL